MDDSLKKRFSYKLITNFFGLISSIIVAGIIPRGLGPVAYGNYSFLTSFFENFFSFFDTGPSNAFYTRLSQNPAQNKLIKFYWLFIGLLGIIVILSVLFFAISDLHNYIWPDQKLLFVWMALLWGFLMLVDKVMVRIVDAYSLTVKGEIVRLLQKVIRVILILIMFWLGLFTLFNFFILQYIIILLLAIGLILLFKKKNVHLYTKAKFEKDEIKNIIIYFWKYSAPLFLFSLFGLAEGIFDRWVLQDFAGSVQQGFYGLSARVASICFLFTSAITPLILREFAIAFGKADTTRIKKLYLKFGPIFFSSLHILQYLFQHNRQKLPLCLVVKNTKVQILR